MTRHQVVVVGGGLAGLRAALEAASSVDVAVVSKVHPLRSHSVAAQGGINAPLGNHPESADDSVEKHTFDTVKGSDFLADQSAVELMISEAAPRVYEMEHWGVPFSRTEDGRIAQRPFGGAGYPRTCYAADRTGHVLLHTMFQKCVERGIGVYEEMQALALAVADGACCGVVALDRVTGRVEAFRADAVVLATGGAGRIYGRSTNAIINTGSGMALAYWAGVPIKDMEFVQFHPTSLIGTNILITEGARGEGGHLINKDGRRFMEDYSPKFMELAPRDIVARAIQTEIDQGRGIDAKEYVYLDLRHLGKEKIMERLPGIREICVNFVGVDPIDKPIPIQPGQHYTMGGVDCDATGASPLAGLYAAGEAACVSVHGANRLGGNSLLETIAFGKIAGEWAAKYVAGASTPAQADRAVEDIRARCEDEVARLVNSTGGESPGRIREALRQVMSFQVGIFRNEKQMREALEMVRDLKARFEKIGLSYRGTRYNLDLARALELKAKVDLAEVIAVGALARKESRGSHYFLEHTDRDDTNFLKHTLATYAAEGPALSYRAVEITKYQPEARAY